MRGRNKEEGIMRDPIMLQCDDTHRITAHRHEHVVDELIIDDTVIRFAVKYKRVTVNQ